MHGLSQGITNHLATEAPGHVLKYTHKSGRIIPNELSRKIQEGASDAKGRAQGRSKFGALPQLK